MTDEAFYIAFGGPACRFPALSAFYERLASKRKALIDSPDSAAAIQAIIREPAWIDILDAEAFQKVTGDGWDLESILYCILNGEYTLIGLSFDGRSGRLVYDPWAYPFGGTDPLKALLTTFGFEVTRDSFHDGYAEWVNRQIE